MHCISSGSTSAFVFLFFGFTQGTVIEGPNDVIYIPGQTPLPIELICNITGPFVTWEVDAVTYTIGNINDGNLPGHRASGTNILLVDVPMNNTKYTCVSNNLTNVIGRSEPAFLYVAAAPDQVPGVMVITDSITLNDDNVTLTLSWGEPFNNFDPIVNYSIHVTYLGDNARIFSTIDSTTRSYTIINLIPITNYTFSVAATNSIGSGETGVVMITTPTLPGNITGVMLMCEVMDQINQCTVQWDPIIVGSGPLDQPVVYEVNYNGTVQSVTSPNTTLTFTAPSLPDGVFDGYITVTVTAINRLGAGLPSDPEYFLIMSSSIVEIQVMFALENVNTSIYSITVTCTINPDSTADVCEVIATASNHIFIGIAPIINGVATVTINGLVCEEEYMITAGGTLNGQLVGPRSSRGTITGYCPPVVTPTIVPTESTDRESTDNNDNGAIVGGVVGGICGLLLLILIIIQLWWCGIRNREKSSNAPVAMSNIPVNDTVQDPAVSDKVKMDPNPAYQVLTSDQANKGLGPTYQDLSSYSGKASVSKQKPAGDVNCYEDIVNEQIITMNKNPSYAVP